MNNVKKNKLEYAGMSQEEREALADMSNPKWTQKHRIFASAFLATGDISKATAQAYPDCKMEYRYQWGYELRHKPHIAAYIDTTIKRNMARYDVTNERLIAEAAKLAFANPGQHLRIQDDGTFVIDFSAMTEDDLAAIAEADVESYVEKDADGETALVKRVKVKSVPKLAAIELLMRHKKMLTDKVEFSGGIDIAARMIEGRARIQPEEGSNGKKVQVKNVKPKGERPIKKDGIE